MMYNKNKIGFENYKEFYKNNPDAQWPQKRSCTNIICSFRRSFHETALGRNSYALNLFGESFRFLIGNIIFSSERKNDINFRYTLEFPSSSIPMNSGNTDTDEIAHAKLISEGDISFDAFLPPLQKFVRLSKEYNFVPIVIYLPSAYTPYYNYTNFQTPEWKELLSGFSDSQRNFFREKGKELGYVFLDAVDPLRNKAEQNTSSDSLLYFPTNIHFTPLAHGVVADFLSEELATLKNFR